MIKSLRISCIFFILIFFLTFLLNCSQFKQNNPIASNGVIDLSTWNPNIESINLKGNWEFCWDQWIPPNAEESQWKENCNGFYIRWTEILSAFQIFINNKSVAQVGILGTDFNTMTPKLKPDRTEIGPQNNQMTIVIWVSNFNHQNHGFWQPIYLGKWGIIRNTQVSHLMMDVASFASIVLIGFYHLVLFLFRTRSKEYLFFGLFCISMGIRQLSVEDHAFIIFFPDIDFDFYIRFIYFTVLSIGIFMCMFIKSFISGGSFFFFY
ncbi:7TM diverse intracellular signaling domain protein [Leptospira interrogans str. L1207]|nr:7TM diverse intracellular signaling domain protein [Leptospira interrogans str. L1207]